MYCEWGSVPRKETPINNLEQPTSPPPPPETGGEPQQPYYAPPPKRSGLAGLQDRGGVLGAIATALIFLAKVGGTALALLSKFKILLILGKVLLTGGTMLLSMWAYSVRFGWPFGIGLVLLIFFHECGHAIASRLRGHAFGMMMFVPFMGAFVTSKGGGRTVTEDAYIGIMGPIFGAIGGIICLLIYLVHPAKFWLVLAQFNFFMNLFNLIPMAPLDGGWIAPVFSPKLLVVGVVLLFIVAPRNPLIWILALASLPRIIGGWKARPQDQPYYQVTAKQRWQYGLAYLGLAGFLAIGSAGLQQLIS